MCEEYKLQTCLFVTKNSKRENNVETNAIKYSFFIKFETIIVKTVTVAAPKLKTYSA